jgi:hypothetical protein
MTLSPTIFVHGGIGFPLPSIIKSYAPDSRSGRKVRLRPWLPKGNKEVGGMRKEDSSLRHPLL